MVNLGELVMILDLHRQGLTVSAIARQLELDRKTVRKYIERGLEPPAYGPRRPRSRRLEPFEAYLRQRVAAYPGLTGSRLLREIRERGYNGGYTAVTDFLREVRPAPSPSFEIRFETPPGQVIDSTMPSASTMIKRTRKDSIGKLLVVGHAVRGRLASVITYDTS